MRIPIPSWTSLSLRQTPFFFLFLWSHFFFLPFWFPIPSSIISLHLVVNIFSVSSKQWWRVAIPNPTSPLLALTLAVLSLHVSPRYYSLSVTVTTSLSLKLSSGYSLSQSFLFWVSSLCRDHVLKPRLLLNLDSLFVITYSNGSNYSELCLIHFFLKF